MYNEFDSRALGRTNCFAQRFMRPGDYPYAVVPGHGQALSTDHPLLVHVKEAGKKSDNIVQHDLRVLEDAKGRLTVDTVSLTIGVGDLVMWNGGGTSPYAVVGQAEFFNSYRMMNECGFSHAFGRSGDYEWRDAFGSGLCGSVHVRDPDCTRDPVLKKWRAALQEGTVVTIADGRVDRPEVNLLTGQTVFFAIVKSSGVSITDCRLLEQPWLQRPDCEAVERA